MSSIAEIELAIVNLSRGELAKFRAWFETFAANEWDEQIADDVAAGKLDALADEAISDLQVGRCTDL